MNKKKGVYINGSTYYEDDKCPACSGERDIGGRLCLRKRTNHYLVCRKCKYAVKGEQSILKQEIYLKKRNDKKLGLK